MDSNEILWAFERVTGKRVTDERVRPVSQSASLLMTQSGQFTNPLDCQSLSYPDSLDSPQFHLNSLPPPTIDI